MSRPDSTLPIAPRSKSTHGYGIGGTYGSHQSHSSAYDQGVPRSQATPKRQGRGGISFFALIAVEVLAAGAAFVMTHDYLSNGPITQSTREAFAGGIKLATADSVQSGAQGEVDIVQPESQKKLKKTASGATVYQQGADSPPAVAETAPESDSEPDPEAPVIVTALPAKPAVKPAKSTVTPVASSETPSDTPQEEPAAPLKIVPASNSATTDQEETVTVTTTESQLEQEAEASPPEEIDETQAPAEDQEQPTEPTETLQAVTTLPAAIPAPQQPVVSALATRKTPNPEVKSFRDCDVCPEMISVEGGKVALDRTDQNALTNAYSGKYPKLIVVKPFAIGRYEITFADWELCVADGDCKQTPSDEGWGREQRPVINVSYNDISKQYLPWLSRKTGKTYRVPTDAEWELAVHGVASGPVVQTVTVGQQVDQPCEIANAVKKNDGCDDGFEKTAPVGSFKPNPIGLYDMQGNIWEWVADCWYPNYSASQVVGGIDCKFRILRGGSWLSDPYTLSIATRGWEIPAKSRNTIGFRVVRSDPPAAVQ